MENNQSDIIFEQYFPANISREKQLFLLDLIEKTVELSDTVYPIDGIKNGKLINMHLKKVMKILFICQGSITLVRKIDALKVRYIYIIMKFI
jgi:hypothetical protein